MITLALILLVVGAALAVVLFAGSLFFQGYFYTQPAEGLAWRAPAAAGMLTLFLFVWCWLVAQSPGASPLDIPYDTVFRFSPRVDMVREPVKELWAVKKGKKNREETHYTLRRSPTGRYEYIEKKRDIPWRGDGVVEIMLVDKAEKMTFKLAPVEEGGNREFVSDTGWTLREYATGPTGIPSTFRWGRFLMNFVLNVGFFVLWFAVLWLVIHFQWPHALGFAVVLWLTFTLAVLPMLLTTAAQAAPPA